MFHKANCKFHLIFAVLKFIFLPVHVNVMNFFFQEWHVYLGSSPNFQQNKYVEVSINLYVLLKRTKKNIILHSIVFFLKLIIIDWIKVNGVIHSLATTSSFTALFMLEEKKCYRIFFSYILRHLTLYVTKIALLDLVFTRPNFLTWSE